MLGDKDQLMHFLQSTVVESATITVLSVSYAGRVSVIATLATNLIKESQLLT